MKKKYDAITGKLLSVPKNNRKDVKNDISKIHNNLQRSQLNRKICFCSEASKYFSSPRGDD